MAGYWILFGVALVALLFIFGTGWPSDISIFSKRDDDES
jgi:hypothetical protein